MINNLMDELNVSRSTVHRDLCELEEQGLLHCIRGGAVSTKIKTSFEYPFDVRKDMHLEEKMRIAKAAVGLVSDNETLLLESGTTVCAFATELADYPGKLYIATNDLNSAQALIKNNHFDITVLGGAVRKNHSSLYGFFTENMISQIHADKVFLGVDSIDFNIGFMNFSVEDVQTKRLMIKSSHEVIVLCDHSKFNSIAFVNICGLDDVHTIITGREIDGESVKKLEERGIRVILA